MKRLLNTLYVTVPDAYLWRDGENIVVSVDKVERLRLPIHTLDGIVCFGHTMVTPGALALCGEHQVAVTFLSESGRFQARLVGPVSGNVLLRREQYRRADSDTAAVAFARSCIAAKIANCRTVLQRALRDYPEMPGADPVVASIDRMAKLTGIVMQAPTLDDVRASEGEAANRYFAVFNHLIVAQKEAFQFTVRSRRPPLDNVNALLSFYYTLLMHDVRSALEGVGLDPQVGFLHRDRSGRMSLALDIMEELRPILADRLALSLINRQQVTAGDFRTTEAGGVLLSDKARRTVITAYQERKKEEIMHPYLGEKIAVGLIAHAQALLFARHLRGDIDGYPPFFWK
jgi:CRISPR-associated protein Cas1